MEDESLTPRQKEVARAEAGLMNIEAETELNRITKLNPQSLTSEDRKFLFARRPYLNDENKRIFKEVLESEQKLADQKLADEAEEEGRVAPKEEVVEGEFTEVKEEVKEVEAPKEEVKEVVETPKKK